MRAAVLLFAALAVPVVAQPDLPPFAPEAALGFGVQPLAPVVVPTALAFGPGDADGPDLYATTLQGRVQRVALLWGPAGPVATGVSTAAEGFSQPLGIAFVGSAMFVSDSHQGSESDRTDGRITRVEGAGKRVVVDGLPNGRHNTNHLRLGPDGRLYVANGNSNDNGLAGGPPDVFPYSGSILSVSPEEVSASPAILHWKDEQGQSIPAELIATHPRNADFNAKVEVLAHGFRNVFGVAFSPRGTAYTAMNGADEPASQDLLYAIAPGTDYGFPFCYNVGPPGGVGAQVSVEPNPLFGDPARCAGRSPATALLGWHVCATGLDAPRPGPWGFPAWAQRSVFVAECATFFPQSWLEHTLAQPTTHNTAHKVVRVALGETGNAAEVQDFLTGLALATDVLFGPDGAMYVADAWGVLRVAPAAPTVPLP